MFGHLVRFYFLYKVSLKDDGMYVLNYDQWNTSIPWYASRYWEKSFLNLNIGNARLEAKRKKRGLKTRCMSWRIFWAVSLVCHCFHLTEAVRTVSGRYLKQGCSQRGRLYCSPSSRESLPGIPEAACPFWEWLLRSALECLTPVPSEMSTTFWPSAFLVGLLRWTGVARLNCIP